MRTVTADPALRLVNNDTANAGATMSEPTGSAISWETETPDELPKSPKRLSPLSPGGAKGRKDSCEWGDSNSHGVTHWYLNLDET